MFCAYTAFDVYSANQLMSKSQQQALRPNFSSNVSRSWNVRRPNWHGANIRAFPTRLVFLRRRQPAAQEGNERVAEIGAEELEAKGIVD